jgi:pimeloyl-ACP methyl ester carboxylesterase
MHRLNCDIPLNDAEKKTKVAAPLSSRREFLRAAAASSGAAILSTPFVPATARASIDKVAELVLPSATKAVTPFEIHVPAAALDDLNTRLANTRWPDKEPVADWSEGVPLAKARALVDYWRTRYDWRRVERTLNALPQFRTQLDGLGIHFIHVRSRHPDALPIIITHGWPGSVIEFLQVIAPLVDPTAHGGEPDDAFHVVIPSLPGFGFSDKPTEPGWRLPRIAEAWEILMQRLGYTHYVAQGGDWGAGVTSWMAKQQPSGLVAIHLNLPILFPPPTHARRTAEEQATPSEARPVPTAGSGYASIQARPQTLGCGLPDSPVRQAMDYESFRAGRTAG